MTHLDFSPFIVELTPRSSIAPMSAPVKAQKTILLVDDDTTARFLLRLAFQTDPYQILEAADGETALTLCRNSQPELILLNITLPHTDGITVLQQIRQINQQTIILMISAINMQIWIERTFAHGADGFIAKPFSLMALRRTVAHLLENDVDKHPSSDAQLLVPYSGKPLSAVHPRHPK